MLYIEIPKNAEFESETQNIIFQNPRWEEPVKSIFKVSSDFYEISELNSAGRCVI